MDEEAGGNETDSGMNVSSDWLNRIEYIPHTCWVQMLVFEIPNIAMNFSSAGVWANQPNIPLLNRKRSLRMTRRPTKGQERFWSKWMVRRSAIQIIPVQYRALFWTQWTTTMNTSVLRRRSGCWMPIRFTNHQMIVFQATSIQFLAWQEQSFWLTRFGLYGSL